MRAYFYRVDNQREQMTLTIEERQENEFEFCVFSRVNPKNMESVTLNKSDVLRLVRNLLERVSA